MDSFTSPWPSPPRDLDDMPGDTLQMDMITDLKEQFEPQTRARSNTWPLPRPDNFVEPIDDSGSNQQLSTCEFSGWVNSLISAHYGSVGYLLILLWSILSGYQTNKKLVWQTNFQHFIVFWKWDQCLSLQCRHQFINQHHCSLFVFVVIICTIFIHFRRFD